MRLQKFVLLLAVALFIYFSIVIFLSASYALFRIDVRIINRILGSLESSSSDFTVSFDPSYQNTSGTAPYYIVPNSVCNQYDDNFNCVDIAPNLCPYLSLQSKNEESTEIGFTQNKTNTKAKGQLNNPAEPEDQPDEPIDETDIWTLSVNSPCFEGECPADYNASQNGDPLPQVLKGQTFKCDLEVLAADDPPLVKNYLKNSVAYADTFSSLIEVSAKLTGELPTPVRNPVIIIPGVLGTEINKGGEKLWLDLLHNLTDIGDQFMDALQFNEDLTPVDTSLTLGDVIRRIVVTVKGINIKFYDYSYSLLGEFENQGYVEGTDLFLFPYDWRSGVNEENIGKLKQKISDVMAESDASKVDIVAHSTGGLLLKKYVMENPADNHIDKAVFVGVPNTGAPKAIKVLVQGDGFDIPFLADREMQKISKNLPVVYDLSPSEKYFNIKGSYVTVIKENFFGYTEKDLNFNEANNWLSVDHRLNAQALSNSHHLHTADFDDYDMRTAGVDLYAINGCKAATLGQVRELHSHSFIFGSNISYLAPGEVPGDGTVPLESSTNLPINENKKYYALKANHGEMLSQDGIREQIVNILSGSTLSTGDIIAQDISRCKLNGRAISIYSPLSIDIVDQDDNHAGLSSDGLSIENNIPNADFQIMGEHKFVYLPTDEGQTYIISVVGTGMGTFTLTDTLIDANDITGMQVFENISVTPSLLGHLILSENTTLELDTNGDGATDETLIPTSTLNGEEAENFIPDKENTDSHQSKNSSKSGSNSGGRDTAISSETATAFSKPIFSVEIPILKQKTANALISPKVKTEESESFPQKNVLVANAINRHNLINYKVTIIAIGGILIILLLAKKFGKL